MNVLVLNSGSSSLRYRLVGRGEETLAAGYTERIATPLTRRAAVRAAVRRANDIAGIDAVGHRVVHGGERFQDAVLIDGAVIAALEAVTPLAPLHNPANLAGIVAARDLVADDIPQVAVFDTAFHATIAESRRTYALPYELARRHGIRRYGFHGIAHRWLALRYAELTARPLDRVNIVTLHLGNGCSATAIRGGVSFNTTMGFTPLEGLVMGTRAGDIDPGALLHLVACEHLDAAGLATLLNHESGLLGVSGISADMRDLLAAEADGNERAHLAIELFCARATRYVGGFLAEMGGADAIVFSGGIGENAPGIRRRIATGLRWLGLDMNDSLNEGRGLPAERELSRDGSRLRAFVIPADEERLIARDVVRVATVLIPEEVCE